MIPDLSPAILPMAGLNTERVCWAAARDFYDNNDDNDDDNDNDDDDDDDDQYYHYY